MKYKINIEDGSKILAAVANAENLVAKFHEAREAYEEAEMVYAQDYSISARMQISNMFDASEKAKKAAFRAIKFAAKMMDMLNDREQEDFAGWFKGYYFIDRAIYRLKGYAKAQMMYINYNL